jgi:hypothetical protein
VILEVSNGFGKLLPYQIGVLGQPSQVVELTRFDQLVANASLTNPIKPPTEWPVTAVLPTSLAGNHFIYARFSQPIDPTSVLSQSVTGGVGQLGAGIEMQSVNPVTGVVTAIKGHAFVGGQTFGPDVSATDPTKLALQTWITGNGTGGIQAATIGGATPGLGFPGTETGFAGDAVLIEPATFVFVVDQDDDLSTHETFPTGVQVQMRITTGVRSARGKLIEEPGLASSTVGPDVIPPEVLVEPGSQSPSMTPADLSQDVDPQTNVVMQFTEPVQILTVGSLANGTPPALSAAIQLQFGPNASKVNVPFTVQPVSIYDLTRYILAPVYDFPGTGPSLPDVDCGDVFGKVDVVINQGQFLDLSGNKNTNARSASFQTREGPGLVNAPVTPDAVYIGRTGSNQGISVIDLNGFGQGTGNPTYDIAHPIVKGNSNFPNNPNVALNGAILTPPLAPGSCTFNGGSAGPFTLALDSSLQDLLTSKPQIESVGDMALGHALDNTFNNEQPFGCQAGGGNLCAQSGLKFISIISGGPNTVASVNISTQTPLKSDSGIENLASWAPHPNPPPLTFPPLCLSPLINGLEPTSIVSINQGLSNLLVPGPFPQGIPSIELPPQGTLTTEQNCYFEGPSTPQPNVSACAAFMMRQQVGQFLYVLDRVAGEVVVFNSNRFLVLDRIRMSDPTSMAMSPNLDFLAVTNQGGDQVSFVDIDPGSATFHQIIKVTRVGTGPTGIAWESSNEDIFVCNQGEGTVSVISGFTLDVRKTLRNGLTRPIDVALTPRQQFFGFSRGVYFGYILNQNGKVAVFESGPDGVNGIGFDDVISGLPFTFLRPKALQVDPTNLNSAVWIAHEIPLDEEGQPTGETGGALSNVGITGGTVGAIPLDGGLFANPSLRDLKFSVIASFGEGPGSLSGIPVDIAFDNMRNLSALTNYSTTFSPGNPLSWNGKCLVKLLNGATLSATAPQFMMAAVPNPGVVDVFKLTGSGFERVDTDAFTDGTQSIPAPNAAILMDYFRQ